MLTIAWTAVCYLIAWPILYHPVLTASLLWGLLVLDGVRSSSWYVRWTLRRGR